MTGAGPAGAARSQDERACDRAINYIVLQYRNAGRDFVHRISVYCLRVFLDTMGMNDLDKFTDSEFREF